MSESKRVRVELEPFIRAWESCNSVKEVSEKLGIKETSVMARASKYRGEPFKLPLKSMPRVGGMRLDLDAARNLIATLQAPKTEETVSNEGE